MIRSSNACAARRFCVFLLLILSLCAAANATNLTGTFKNPDGTPVNGKIIFLLSQPTRLNDQSAQIVPMVRIFSVTNGALESGAFVYGNDVLVPGGTYYLVRLVDNNNNLLFEQKWSISGVSLNLGTLTPTTTGVVFPDPLIKNLATDQAVQGPVSFSAPITAFSLTLNGNLNPGVADAYELGSSSAPWQELHAQRWNSLFAVGSSSGTATPPAVAPGASVQSTGGSIGAGTYYFKITYFNRNGETTASPTKTLTVSSGTTNRIHTGPGDYLWASGCYGFITYASNDNVNFYAQTPSGVLGDFELSGPGGKTGHYVTMGSMGPRFNSLTFSGAPPPSTNTTTIDPLQVALNATMRQSDYLASNGALLVPGPASATHVMTTPLIVPRYAQIRGVTAYGAGKTDSGGSRIYGAWTDPKLAVVMTFGGYHTIENIEVLGPGHTVMMLAGVGYQGEAEIAKNSAYRTSDATNTYAALKILGVHYNLHHQNVYLRGGKAAVQAQNISGGEWSFKDTRWDLGGSSAIQNITGWTDPDNGANDAGFSNGVGTVRVQNVLTEMGSGIIWDVVNLNLSLENVQVADLVTLAGTDSLARIGCDAKSGGTTGGQLTLINSSPGVSGTARVGTFVYSDGTCNATTITMLGNSGPGMGGSTGVSIGLDANNINLFLTGMVTGNGANFTLNPNPATSSSIRAINVPNNSRNIYFGGGKNSGGEPTWNEITGRLVFNPDCGNNCWNRASRATIYNDGASFIFLKPDDATEVFKVGHTGGANAGVGYIAGLRIGTNPAQVTGTGDIGIRNSGWLWWRNAANSADIPGITVNGSDQIQLGSTSAHTVRVKGQVVSDIATGTAPLVVASTTEVANLNAALLKGATWAAPAAIGSATPVAITGTTIAANTSLTVGSGTAVTQIISATATLDFAAITAPNCAADLTITVTGAATGDSVFLAVPTAAQVAGVQFNAWVSATNTVTVRACAFTATPDPASGSFRATVIRF